METLITPVFLFYDLPGSRLSWGLIPDNQFPPAMSKYLSNTIPNTEAFFVPDAGHLWILEHLNEVLIVIKKTVVDTK